MAQYEIEFISLARLAPELVSIEAKKMKKFQKGLRLQVDIRHVLAGVRILNYSIVVQRAYVIERDKIELGNGQGVQRKMGNKKRK